MISNFQNFDKLKTYYKTILIFIKTLICMTVETYRPHYSPHRTPLLFQLLLCLEFEFILFFYARSHNKGNDYLAAGLPLSLLVNQVDIYKQYVV